MAVETTLQVSSLICENSHFIDGKWTLGESPESIEVINPANQEILLAVPRGTAADVDRAATVAAAAYPRWRAIGPSSRAALLYRWADLCDANETTLSLLESLEVGRPDSGRSPIGSIIRYTAGLADKITGMSLPVSDLDGLASVQREPYGVVGSIIPWNYPGPGMTSDVAPAIAAGNTIVVKPAEDAPLTCLLIAKLAVEAGIPPGVINVVTGFGPEAGAALPRHPLIRRISFTGSPETGSEVMKGCAESLIPLHLELGGKSPQIVFHDADLTRAVPSIVASITSNSGQACGAGSRMLVDRRIQDQVLSAVAAAFAQVAVGPWYEPVTMGPLISQAQEQRVLGYIATGRDEGARVLVGGEKLSGEKFDRGFFVPPTLFTDVAPDMRIANEEIFGPVLSAIPFVSEDEALEVANGTPYGLVATVWTTDVSRAVRFANRLQSGTVGVNCNRPDYGAIGAPHGGYKHSGFGRAMGIDAILDYTQTKSLIIR